MAEIRRDSITHRSIIVLTENSLGPADFDLEPHRGSAANCPFCPGNERMTPVEIAARRPAGAGPNGPGWTMRVVPNKFPALRVEGDLNRTGVGIYDMMNGVGAHEVFIESPDHAKSIPDLTPAEMRDLLTMFIERSLDLKKDKRLRYLLIFKNYGESAGASLSHSHSQLIALPIVPTRVQEEMDRAQAYLKEKERCVFCDVIHQELEEAERVVFETPHMLCYTPFVSRFPFELWILPKEHLADFPTTPQEILSDLGDALQQAIGKMKKVLRDPSYNFIIHTSPLEATPSEGYHWHVEIMPRLTRVAGFEWGSGFYINPTPPEAAAKYLRGETVLFKN